MPRIYLSPERRPAPHGKYLGKDMYERKYCYHLAELIAERVHPSVEVEIADPEMLILDRTSYANNQSFDAYICIHTNAAVKPNTATGCEMLLQGNSASKHLNQLIYDGITALYPSTRGLKDGSYYIENNYTKCVTAYAEIAFHDNSRDVDFLLKDKERIADAFVSAIHSYFGITASGGDWVQKFNAFENKLYDLVDSWTALYRSMVSGE